MWNRQREAEAARERLAQMGDDAEAVTGALPPTEAAAE
jgi:ATP-binding cassette subfamily B protein